MIDLDPLVLGSYQFGIPISGFPSAADGILMAAVKVSAASFAWKVLFYSSQPQSSKPSCTESGVLRLLSGWFWYSSMNRSTAMRKESTEESGDAHKPSVTMAAHLTISLKATEENRDDKQPSVSMATPLTINSKA